MSEPITTELRRKMDTLGWYDEDGNIVYTTSGLPAGEMACLVINSKTFGELCDAIDAVHANLERENEALRKRLAEPGGGARSIGSATVTITPTLDWTGVARELRSIADALGSCNCTNSERTNETCRDLGGTGANGEQVFDCSECGCVLSLYDRDGTNTLCTHFIYDYPRYCPECGRKVVNE